MIPFLRVKQVHNSLSKFQSPKMFENRKVFHNLFISKAWPELKEGCLWSLSHFDVNVNIFCPRSTSVFDSEVRPQAHWRCYRIIGYVPILHVKSLKKSEFQTHLSFKVSEKRLWICISSILTSSQRYYYPNSVHTCNFQSIICRSLAF